MSVSVAGLAVLSVHDRYADLRAFFAGAGDVRHILGLLVFSIVFLILAYLTNPTENSFRTYLTEQSFRHHLSRLDDGPDDKAASSTRDKPCGTGSPFHFANRASISLRTPKHVFHSFGICTVAAMVPLSREERAAMDGSPDRDGSMISDSWYIGAFGKWWRGGVIEAWYQDVLTRTADEESWSSGILTMKALDRLNGFHGIPLSQKNFGSSGAAKNAPPRLRNRERPSQRQPSAAARSSTPPPLPKSASLPLHTPRSSPAAADHPETGRNISQSLAPATLAPDQSPRIVELRKQITTAKSSLADLRTQFTDSQTSASESRAVLQTELDSIKEKRRLEDHAKAEVKSKTKTLDDAKRLAESQKRDAEKRLKAAQNARDDASQRIGRLDSEIVVLQQQLGSDREMVERSKDGTSEAEKEIAEALEHKRREVKVSEEVVAALALRAKDLEETLHNERERLRQIKERNQDVVQHNRAQSSPWSPLFYATSDSPNSRPSRASTDLTDFSDVSNVSSRSPSISRDTLNSPRPARLSLGALSNFRTTNSAIGNLATFRTGLTPAERELGSAYSRNTGTSSNFSVFDEDTLRVPPSSGGLLSPTGQSLIPAGLISSLDSSDGFQQSYSPDPSGFNRRSDDHLEHGNPVKSSASSPTTNDLAEHHGRDPFQVQLPATREHLNFSGASRPDTDMVKLPVLFRTHSDPRSESGIETSPSVFDAKEKSAVGPRRWFSASAKQKVRSGLNPEAKEFNFIPKPSSLSVATPAPSAPLTGFDALNPNGILSSSGASATSNSSLLRAFAPSPAEREALQRALGSSTNTSLERLPSLSDVGSIPSSPVQRNAQPTIGPAPSTSVDLSHGSTSKRAKVIPSWLQVPRGRKTTFSPWADEDDATPTADLKVNEKAPW